MQTSEYIGYDGVGLARLVRDKEVTPAELLDTALAQLARCNPALNAVTSVLEQTGRDTIAGGLPEGTFRGVPFLIKDLSQELAGTVTTGSCRVLLGRVCGRDSTLVQRLRAAGLVIFGKTSTPELGLSVTTEPAMFGPARNPWDLDRTTGGSSGGSAAAIAGGIVPMAQASDSGGSIRIPASCCGLVGLKPTRGRNPLGPGQFEGMGGAATTHALTRTVRDCAALLDATAGGDAGDPYLCHPHARPFLSETVRPPGQLRIAVMAEPYADVPVDPEVSSALAATVSLLESLGHRPSAARPALDAGLLTAGMPVVFGAHAAVQLDQAAARRGRAWQQGEVEPLTWQLVTAARSAGTDSYVAAIDAWHQATRTVQRFHEEWDVLVCPTLATPPVPVGALAGRDGGQVSDAWNGYIRFAPFTAIANLTGQPAISLPLARTRRGLPIGVMFTAGLGREGLLLRLAAQLEEATPWPRVAPIAGESPRPSRQRPDR
jgi:Asp-tRNA(Asn)/Glu-tRNA(Gln) amidotransferase A subunit family amidase